MPKQAKSSTAKVRKICRQYPNEFEATPAGDLRWKFCDILVKCDKKFFVESHRKSKLHHDKLVTTSSSQGKQTYCIYNSIKQLVTTSSSQGKQTYIQLDQANFK